MKELLARYSRRLNNLTGRNPLLRVLSMPLRRCMDFHSLDFALDKHTRSFSLLEGVILRRKRVKLVAYTGSEGVSGRLSMLQQQDISIQQETGSYNLHIGWPVVEGQLNDGHPIRCPLLLFPILLESDGRHWYLRPRMQSEAVYNQTFLLSYFSRNGLSCKEEDMAHFSLPQQGEGIKTAREFITFLYNTIKESKLRLDFSSEHYEETLQNFLPCKRDDLLSRTRSGILSLKSQALFGLFSPPNAAIQEDYDRLEAMEDLSWDDFFAHVEQKGDEAGGFLGRGVYTGVSRAMGRVVERDLISPMRMDASQEAALQRIKDGESLIVQGPPGTGKSQLIANIICDFLARKKRVLLVCAKRVALDVVYTRLAELSLAPFLAKVSDVRNDRMALYKQLSHQIEKLEHFDARKAAGSVEIEHSFAEASRYMQSLVDELEILRHALLDSDLCGISAGDLYGMADFTQPSIDMRAYCSSLATFSAYSDFLLPLREYIAYSKVFGRSHACYDRVSFAEFGSHDLRELLSVGKVCKWLVFENWQRPHLFGRVLVLRDLRDCVGQEKELRLFMDYIGEAHSDTGLLRAFMTHAFAQGEISKRITEVEGWESVLRGLEGKEMLLLGKELHELARDSVRVLLRTSLWARFFMRRQIGYLRKVLGKAWEGLSTKKLGYLKERLDRGSLFALCQKEMGDCFGDWAPMKLERGDSVRDWAEFCRKILCLLKGRAVYEGTLLPGLAIQWSEGDEGGEGSEGSEGFVGEIKAWFARYLDERAQWEAYTKYFSPVQLDRLASEKEKYAEALAKAIDVDFEELRLFDRLRAGLTSWQKALIEALYRQAGSWDAQHIVDLYQNSWAQAWIEEVEQKHDVLRILTGDRLAKKEADLRQWYLKKEQCSKQLVFTRLWEALIEKFRSRASGARVHPFKKPLKQLIKRRQVWAIRKLLETFSQELFTLVPCWMTSPEAASALFFMKKGMFDIVLFDESSQTFAESAFPVLYRAKQRVIIGDKHQLQPNTLYIRQWEEEAEAEDVVGEEMSQSLLDLASDRLESVRLLHHYRSESPWMIHFSNARFYDGHLRLLPAFSREKEGDFGIFFHEVTGIWQSQTNMEEAREVLEIAKRLASEKPKESMGIITFNRKQQELLSRLKDEYRYSGAYEESEAWNSLFVKNLENVQGDERDNIILSVGYAADKDGKFSYHFGSLSHPGGENRLNVAVTRARKQMHVVCSAYHFFEKAKDSKSTGVRYLREYLQMVYKMHTRTFLYPEGEEQKTEIHEIAQRLKKTEGMPSAWQLVSVPYADACITHNDCLHTLLFRDTMHYKDTLSAKDFHLYRSLHLHQKKWNYFDIYNRNIWLGKAYKPLRALWET